MAIPLNSFLLNAIWSIWDRHILEDQSSESDEALQVCQELEWSCLYCSVVLDAFNEDSE